MTPSAGEKNLALNRVRVVTAVLWCALVALGWLAYAPALGGTFLLDDFPNLEGLAGVSDWPSALAFSFSGTAGPLGRPLALLTFVPQAEFWDGDAEPFLRVNILLHLANACLLCWILHRLAVIQGLDASRAAFAAIAGAALWMFMPLLASASLLIIQRMTTLSAFFLLLGAAGYLAARARIETSPRNALIGMSAALVAGTLLAVLTKENGALLPVLMLVMEATVLRRPAAVQATHWRAWKGVFLVLPAVAILAFLAYRIPWSEEVILRRDFTVWERLLTEARILWQYLLHAFLPQPWKLGPFHDGYPVSRTLLDPVTAAAAAGWLLLTALALVWRRRYPLFAFGALWFVAGHLLESTTVPLDLYFEHRNYVPLIGPVYAVAAAVAMAGAQFRRIAYGGFSAYVVLQGLVLFSVTSLWGSPGEALLHWKDRFPDSRYAITASLPWYLSTRGPEETLRYLRMLSLEHPGFGHMRLYELDLSCEVRPEYDHAPAVVEIVERLEKSKFTYTMIALLSRLLDRPACNGLDAEAVTALAQALMRNPRYAADPAYNHLHHKLMALVRQKEGRPEQAMEHLNKAMEHGATSDLNTMIVTTYIARAQFEEAYRFIEQARSDAPRHPLRRYVWRRKLEDLAAVLARAELGSR